MIGWLFMKVLHLDLMFLEIGSNGKSETRAFSTARVAHTTNKQQLQQRYSRFCRYEGTAS